MMPDMPDRASGFAVFDRLLSRLRGMLNMKRGELPLAAMSALFFFLVLFGYFFLRPVREAMGVARGMEELRWLFVATSVTALVAVLAFGGVVARMNRRRFIPVAYLFVIVCLIGFAALLIQDVRSGGGLIGTDAQTGLSRGVGYTFYIWLTVINLFTTSVFWAFMVDIFDVDQGKRLFAFIGIGGTLGAFLGGLATNRISGMTETPYLPAGLMLIGAGCLALAIAVMLMLDRMAVRSEVSSLGAVDGGSAGACAAAWGPNRTSATAAAVTWSQGSSNRTPSSPARSTSAAAAAIRSRSTSELPTAVPPAARNV